MSAECGRATPTPKSQLVLYLDDILSEDVRRSPPTGPRHTAGALGGDSGWRVTCPYRCASSPTLGGTLVAIAAGAHGSCPPPSVVLQPTLVSDMWHENWVLLGKSGQEPGSDPGRVVRPKNRTPNPAEICQMLTRCGPTRATLGRQIRPTSVRFGRNMDKIWPRLIDFSVRRPRIIQEMPPRTCSERFSEFYPARALSGGEQFGEHVSNILSRRWPLGAATCLQHC